jgi:hypothetical protein
MTTFNLHFVRSGEDKYIAMKGPNNNGGGAMPQTLPQPWASQLGRALEQVGFDPLRIAMLKKEIDAMGSQIVNDCELSKSQLRVLGFNDV